MRMSCNGCRVLRKGCSEDCTIRPCLQWIKSSESQANATVFLAKFYGRAGLLNLINAGPDHLRPAIFRSLLYEACGRMVNPIYGSVGLLWSGQWQSCQAAVEAVLNGAPIVPISTEAAANPPPPPVKGYDIRHLTKHDDNAAGSNSAESRRLKPTRTRFKRTGPKPKPKPTTKDVMTELTRRDSAELMSPELTRRDSAELNGSSTSHEYDSSVSHPDEMTTTDASMVSAEADVEERENDGCGDDGELELELTLGFGSEPAAGAKGSELRHDGACRIELGLF